MSKNIKDLDLSLLEFYGNSKLHAGGTDNAQLNVHLAPSFHRRKCLFSKWGGVVGLVGPTVAQQITNKVEEYLRPVGLN